MATLMAAWMIGRIAAGLHVVPHWRVIARAGRAPLATRVVDVAKLGFRLGLDGGMAFGHRQSDCLRYAASHRDCCRAWHGQRKHCKTQQEAGEQAFHLDLGRT